jgi:hypothetical protein
MSRSWCTAASGSGTTQHSHRVHSSCTRRRFMWRVRLPSPTRMHLGAPGPGQSLLELLLGCCSVCLSCVCTRAMAGRCSTTQSRSLCLHPCSCPVAARVRSERLVCALGPPDRCSTPFGAPGRRQSLLGGTGLHLSALCASVDARVHLLRRRRRVQPVAWGASCGLNRDWPPGPSRYTGQRGFCGVASRAFIPELPSRLSASRPPGHRLPSARSCAFRTSLLPRTHSTLAHPYPP